MKNELNPYKNGMVKFPAKHQPTLVGINWDGIPTAEAFAEIRAFVQTLDRANYWNLADLIVMEVRLALKKNSRSNVKNTIAAFALERGESVQTWERMYGVGKFYAWGDRVGSPLTFTHHRDIYESGVGSLVVAKQWLQKALDNNWNTTQLRVQLIASNRAAQHAEPELPIIFPREFQAACGLASASLDEIDVMPIELLRERIERLEPIIQYTDRARARLAQAPGRESIKAAS